MVGGVLVRSSRACFARQINSSASNFFGKLSLLAKALGRANLSSSGGAEGTKSARDAAGTKVCLSRIGAKRTVLFSVDALVNAHQLLPLHQLTLQLPASPPLMQPSANCPAGHSAHGWEHVPADDGPQSRRNNGKEQLPHCLHEPEPI